MCGKGRKEGTKVEMKGEKEREKTVQMEEKKSRTKERKVPFFTFPSVIRRRGQERDYGSLRVKGTQQVMDKGKGYEGKT